MNMMEIFRCSHGRSLAEDCDRCELEWHKRMLAKLEAKAVLKRRRIAELKKKDTAALNGGALSDLLYCPRCGTLKDRNVFVGTRADELGPRFHCGTIFWPSQKKITVVGVACNVIRELQTKLGIEKVI